jgi:hypothetical protein
MFEPRYHGEVRDPDTTPSQDLATEFNLHLAGSIGWLIAPFLVAATFQAMYLVLYQRYFRDIDSSQAST